MICFTIRFETRSCGIIFIASTVCSLRHVRAAICSAIRSAYSGNAVSNFHDLDHLIHFFVRNLLTLRFSFRMDVVSLWD